MTDPLHTEPVEVTQADRIMCARAVATVEQEHLKSAILRGDYDYTEAMKAFVAHRTAAEAASRAEVERLRAERDFLLARASKAGSCSFGGGRWTGLSSNALVTVAFGGEDDCLPTDSSDLAACYRTMLRLPRHLLSDKVWEQLEDGERYVGSKYPDDIAWAKEAAEWPEAARAALSAADKETPA